MPTERRVAEDVWARLPWCPGAWQEPGFPGLPDSWRIVGTVRGQMAGGSAGTVRGQVAGGSDGTFYPVLSDQIQTPRVVLDPANGDVRWTWQGKEAFGATAPDESPESSGAFRFDARFPGQWADPETGLFHNGFRDYDPAQGRYVKSDPIGLGVGGNVVSRTYGYNAAGRMVAFNGGVTGGNG